MCGFGGVGAGAGGWRRCRSGRALRRICIPPIGTSVGGAFFARSGIRLGLERRGRRSPPCPRRAVDRRRRTSAHQHLSSGGGTWTKPACCSMSLSRYALTRALASFSRAGDRLRAVRERLGAESELVPARIDDFGECACSCFISVGRQLDLRAVGLVQHELVAQHVLREARARCCRARSAGVLPRSSRCWKASSQRVRRATVKSPALDVAMTVLSLWCASRSFAASLIVATAFGLN